jgi:hypothetical protein
MVTVCGFHIDGDNPHPTIHSDHKEPCPSCGLDCPGGSDPELCPESKQDLIEFCRRIEYNAAIDGLESLILAHYCAGIDVEKPSYVEGIQTVLDAFGNNLD